MKRGYILILGILLLLTACKGPDRNVKADGGRVTESQSGTDDGRDTESRNSAGESVAIDPGKQTGESIDAVQETVNAGAGTYDLVRDQLQMDRKTCYLEDVVSLLEDEGLPYKTRYNVSGERLDMTWDDGTRLVFLAITDDMGSPRGIELMMIDGQFNDNGFQENYLNQYDVTIDEEYYPQTANRLLEKEELDRMNQTDLSIARNEIFARHKRRFEDPFLQAVFNRKTWYQPQYTGDEFSALQARLLNSYEKENLKKIIAYEQEKGYRTAGS